ncbi:hypothetical protein VE01_03846 [Pseudogymnoascus verrucosus]|uniref:Carboxylic ester hydrolase n=1 Tax=Pseudogymnoascus verrucosus TaxID=342668 RepID=A0A1B8GQK5_9PEZI|nr:uncharacterized protein VE01_03846 [Pseudogymnoascus verrucosus]OBT98119.1 hypothetical protein VE01_03846 [Pseudogymnoascus verrucosus]
MKLARSLAVLLIAATSGSASSTGSLRPSPAQRYSNLIIRSLPDISIISINSSPVYNYSYPAIPSSNTPVSGVDFCNVTIILDHRRANDSVLVTVWLPFKGWNGRFQATGGGGLAAGLFEPELAPAVAAGYATAGTDGGLTLGGTIDANSGLWVLGSDGTPRAELVKNFAYRSQHDLAIVGKAVTKQFYGTSPKYSYWNGCSTGGRQGYFAAQKYPGDFDGILASAPALNTPQLSVADFWPSVVMANLVAPPKCVFEAYQANIILTCDPLDGVKDGLISNTKKCNLDTQGLIGHIITCDSGNLTITQEHAHTVSKILQGATSLSGNKQWYGIPPGASFNGLANTSTTNGTTIPVPFSSAEAWIRYFVMQDPDYDTAHMTFKEFDNAFSASIAKYSGILGTNEPDLTVFYKRGGKLLTWHGLADPLITHEGTVRYRERLEQRMGGQKKVDEFYRLFLAPGVAHCGGGIGPAPLDPLHALVEWVESGKAPVTLGATGVDSNGTTLTRNLCRYPLLLTYDGKGDINNADSYSCV